MFVYLLVAVALAGCSTVEIVTDHDPAVHFERLRTYAWIPGVQPETGDPRIDNSFLDSRVRGAVDTELAARGYQKDLAARADFLVAYHAALDTRLDVSTIHRHYGAGPRLGGGLGVETVVTEYEQGTLLLDVLDPRTKRLYWRGSAQAQVTARATPQQRKERIQNAVRKLLERFPPPTEPR